MRTLLTLVSAAALAAAASTQTQQVVIPKGMTTSHPGTTSLTWRNTLFHFQMLYDPSHFLDQGIDYPITITRMQFRASSGATSVGGDTYIGVTAMMCSSPSTYAAPSTTFATNLGVDTTTVFTGNVVCLPAAGTSPNTYIIDIPLQTPFVYDPTSGLNFLIDVNAPTAPVPAALPNMASSSSNATHLARRISTATANAATGALSDFASVVLLDFTPPPNLGAVTPYGAGCNDISVSWYENLTTGSFDLSNSSIRMVPNGTGYNVVPGSNAWFTPVAANLGLTDDSLSPAQPLGFTFPFPGGSTTDIKICSNGFVWLDTTQTAATFSGDPALLLGQAPRFAPLWHDMDPSMGGTVTFDIDPSGQIAYATWDQVPLFTNLASLNTFQVALYASGDVEYRYQGCTSDPGIFGWSPGGNANDPGSIDVSASLPFATFADVFPLVLAHLDRPRINRTLNLEVRNVPGDTTLIALNIGVFKVDPPLNLGVIRMPGCFQHASIDVGVGLPAVVPTTPLSFGVPNLPVLIGVHAYLQALGASPSGNPTGILTTNGLDLLIGQN
ncbi:MAG: hypothetical protein IPM29_16210 [Planctomycetes bacterium]|nr:hypothetical protein [Planctomycetota bacterium]